MTQRNHRSNRVQKISAYKKRPLSFLMFVFVIASAMITLLSLGCLLMHILVNGIPYLRPSLFAWEYNSDNVSMMPALIKTICMVLLSLVVAAPIGIFSAIYLVEYAKKESKIVSLITLTAETLSGIPSIVYGLFGTLFFVGTLKFGYSLLSGALTLSIMVLPLIMRTTQEALLSVPMSYREGSFGLGAGKLRTIFQIVLPSAIPGILSGVILAIGRIVGETAALIYTAGTVEKIPSNVLSSTRTLSVHMYSLSKEGLHTKEAYATAVVLLVLVVFINHLSNRIAKCLEKGA